MDQVNCRAQCSTIRKLLTLTKINISDKSLLELDKDYKSDEYFSRKLEQPEEPYVKIGEDYISKRDFVFQREN